MEPDTVSTDDLLFHDFTSASHGVQVDAPPPYSKSESKSASLTAFPEPSDTDEDGDKTELLDGQKKQPSFWTFEYYQAFFDVNSYDVLRRISGSMIPNPRRNYLRLHIRPTPDLYGPFWICTTLVFTTAICGNLANYISCGRYDYEWRYDFHKVTFAAAAIFAYWWLIPTGIFGLLWWRGNPAGYTYMEIICVYGYSLAIYIPVSILWVIPYAWLQWLLVLIGMILSGSVLLMTFWPAVREDVNKRVAWITMAVIFIFHGMLAAGFVLYFFHVPESTCSALVKPTMSPLKPSLSPNSSVSKHSVLKSEKLSRPLNSLPKVQGDAARVNVKSSIPDNGKNVDDAKKTSEKLNEKVKTKEQMNKNSNPSSKSKRSDKTLIRKKREAIRTNQ
ncbi:protein YIPF1-like isoform X2 [Tubulanus polymorphus]|uniref:protein YIPF1-like isoform X2 n=1 Tax=Tubulanus polymorphus TaxID=672921 RepID=UPI003DA4D3F4